MRFRLSVRAERDLADIAAYLHDRSPQAARSVEAQLIAVFQLLSSHPLAGRRSRMGLRRFAVPRMPYLIYYRIDEGGNVLEIVTVRHGARKPFR